MLHGSHIRPQPSPTSLEARPSGTTPCVEQRCTALCICARAQKLMACGRCNLRQIILFHADNGGKQDRRNAPASRSCRRAGSARSSRAGPTYPGAANKNLPLRVRTSTAFCLPRHSSPGHFDSSFGPGALSTGAAPNGCLFFGYFGYFGLGFFFGSLLVKLT